MNLKNRTPNPEPRTPNRLSTYFSFVRFSHTVFALPFALTGALLALRSGAPMTSADALWRLLWIVVAMVAARSAAMGFNRLVDARFDALNPRTAMRELPRGAMTRTEASVFVIIASVVFVVRRLAAGPNLCGAVAARPGHRVLVLAGQALHDVYAVVPGVGHGGGSGRRLVGGRRAAGGARTVAAGSCHRQLGGRIRHPLCVPGPRVRSRAGAPLDSGPLRRAPVAGLVARDARCRGRCVWRRWRRSPISDRSISLAWRWSPRCSSTSNRWSASTTCRS